MAKKVSTESVNTQEESELRKLFPDMESIYAAYESGEFASFGDAAEDHVIATGYKLGYSPSLKILLARAPKESLLEKSTTTTSRKTVAKSLGWQDIPRIRDYIAGLEKRLADEKKAFEKKVAQSIQEQELIKPDKPDKQASESEKESFALAMVAYETAVNSIREQVASDPKFNTTFQKRLSLFSDVQEKRQKVSQLENELTAAKSQEKASTIKLGAFDVAFFGNIPDMTFQTGKASKVLALSLDQASERLAKEESIVKTAKSGSRQYKTWGSRATVGSTWQYTWKDKGGVFRFSVLEKESDARVKTIKVLDIPDWADSDAKKLLGHSVAKSPNAFCQDYLVKMSLSKFDQVASEESQEESH